MPRAELEGIDRRKNEQVHHRLQRFRAIASGLVAAALIAALFGAFGSGPLNQVTRGQPSTLSAKYPPLMRQFAPGDISLQLPATDLAASAEISFNENYVHAFDVVSVTPSPSTTRSADGRIIYGFDRIAEEPMRIVFRTRPVLVGRLTADVATAEGTGVRIQQLVLP